MYQYLYQKSYFKNNLSRIVALLIIVLGITKSAYSQTFPVLPNPNYDVDHASFVSGAVKQDGGNGVSGILVKLKNSEGVVVSYVLTDDQGNYRLSAKAEPDNYTLEIEYPTEGFSIISSPSVLPLSGSQTVNGMDFTLKRNPNTLTVCDAYSSTLTPWGLTSSIYLNIKKPDISIPYSSVKLFTSATTSHPELRIENTNNGQPARVTRLEVGAIVYHEAPSSSSSVNSFMEFAKNNIGGSQNLVVPGSTTYTYYDISSGKTWTSGNLSNASYTTNGGDVQIQIAAGAEITSTISGGNATFSVATNANAGACLVYTYPSDPLPVRLISFDAIKQDVEGALLKWETAEEERSKEFQIEKSMNATNWITIGSVPTTNKGVSLAEYKFYDNENWGGTVYYRLKMVDLDGSFSYSRIRSLTGAESANKLMLFPNPISSSGQRLQLNHLPAQPERVEILSVAGTVVYSLKNPGLDGINIEGVSKGFYVVKAVLHNGQVFSSRLLIK